MEEVLESESGWQEPNTAEGGVVGTGRQRRTEAVDLKKRSRGYLRDELWFCGLGDLIQGGGHQWLVRICRLRKEACQLEGTHRGAEGRCGPSCLEWLVLWTSAPERPSPSTVRSKALSLLLRCSLFSGRHVRMQGRVYHCGKSSGSSFATGALRVGKSDFPYPVPSDPNPCQAFCNMGPSITCSILFFIPFSPCSPLFLRQSPHWLLPPTHSTPIPRILFQFLMSLIFPSPPRVKSPLGTIQFLRASPELSQ